MRFFAVLNGIVLNFAVLKYVFFFLHKCNWYTCNQAYGNITVHMVPRGLRGLSIGVPLSREAGTS